METKLVRLLRPLVSLWPQATRKVATSELEKIRLDHFGSPGEVYVLSGTRKRRISGSATTMLARRTLRSPPNQAHLTPIPSEAKQGYGIG
jgi:hypothetical protein